VARRVRGNELENRTRRLKLPISKKPLFVRVGEGLSLGYRRNQTAGTWVLRVADGQGGASTVAVGRADDFDEADGTNYLTFWQAQEKAKHTARKGPDMAQPLTIQVAAETYLSWLEAKNPRTAADTRGRLNKHFLPKFGAKLAASLTKTILDAWLASMVISSPDAEKVRRSRDSANRVLTMVKALLNHAVRDVTNGIMDDSAWRHVRPFQGVAKPREVRFTQEEVSRLLACAPDKATRNLLTGAFLTGARYGELIEAKIAHFDERSGTLKVNVSKTGARTIVLQSSASEFFTKLTKDRERDNYIFVREDASRWKRSDQTRPIKEALDKGGLPEEGSIYALRHTYISQAIEGGVPLNIIADNCGTSVRMIEKTYEKILAEKRREFIQIGAPSI
jgi:integrase